MRCIEKIKEEVSSHMCLSIRLANEFVFRVFLGKLSQSAQLTDTIPTTVNATDDSKASLDEGDVDDSNEVNEVGDTLQASKQASPPRNGSVTVKIASVEGIEQDEGSSRLPPSASGLYSSDLSMPLQGSDRASLGVSSEKVLRQPPQNHVAATSYPYLDIGCMLSVPLQEFRYLDHCGCFHLPSRDHLEELVQAYFIYVHPHLPLIDEAEFWDIYSKRRPGGRSATRIPLIVLEAILLVASSVSCFL